MYGEFVEEWKIRFINKVCTEDHLNRLLKINRLSLEEYNYIIEESKKENVNHE